MIAQASVYGKCIAAGYNNVYKDKCLNEFLRLKECYLVSIPLKWFPIRCDNNHEEGRRKAQMTFNNHL